jgi:hypothetical protein
MKALGIPEDRICKTITNPRTKKPVARSVGMKIFQANMVLLSPLLLSDF